MNLTSEGLLAFHNAMPLRKLALTFFDWSTENCQFSLDDIVSLAASFSQLALWRDGPQTADAACAGGTTRVRGGRRARSRSKMRATATARAMTIVRVRVTASAEIKAGRTAEVWLVGHDAK